MVQVMGKNTQQPLFRITVSTLDGEGMSFLVKRGYTVNTLSPPALEPDAEAQHRLYE